MINKIVLAVCSTDIIPVAGGSAGAVVGGNMTCSLPSPTAVLTTIILAIVGATVGYLVKMLLDYIAKKVKDRNGPKIEHR